MTESNTDPTGIRGEPLRHRVLDAAEHLLRDGKADFSMRQLASAGGVSFATPFNQFGSKAAIMHALSKRRIDTMTSRFTAAALPGTAAERVMLAIDIAAAVMTEEPSVNRAVMSWVGTAGGGDLLHHSTTLWALALGDGDGLPPARRDDALHCLPRHLAFAFRGVLSFWTAGELVDEALATNARKVAQTLLLGFTDRDSAR